ncbi:unnamed protein product [Symbiodinium natans]|uniref:Uncharacterized protein n=1 Tax=Symbiodinium natans TaxID=878477 RepID=A0A812SRE8_9DINO|nr:unnamed protein product [Symbiodinium natans]
MGLVRGLAGDVAKPAKPFLISADMFDSTVKRKAVMQFDASAAQTVPAQTIPAMLPNVVLQTARATVSQPTAASPMPFPGLPVPVTTAMTSVFPALPGTVGAVGSPTAQAFPGAVTQSCSPKTSQTVGAYPLSSSSLTSPIATSLPSGGKAQAISWMPGTPITTSVQRLQPVRLLAPTVIWQTRPTSISDMSATARAGHDISPKAWQAASDPQSLDGLEGVEQRLPESEGRIDRIMRTSSACLPSRVRLAARSRTVHPRRLLRRPRRSRSAAVSWHDHATPSVAHPWDVYIQNCLAGQFAEKSSSPLRAQHGTSEVLVWHCKHPHGLFSMFSLALGHMETCEKTGTALIVDWSSEELLYRGPPEEPNVWNAFFCQPAELKMSPQALRSALCAGRYKETSSQRVVYGKYKGVIQDYGGIPQQQAAQGRALCKRNLLLRPRFQRKLQDAIDSLPSGRRLAVHIRRSDKACEAAANFELSDEGLKQRIIQQCAAWCMDGVLLCTDDASLKQRLTDALEPAGLSVSTYNSTLPSDNSKAVHFDKTVDAYKKAEDVVMEAFLMARGCHGLLSTYSNVSAAVVYLSHDKYPYTTFWDPLEPLANQPAGQD